MIYLQLWNVIKLRAINFDKKYIFVNTWNIKELFSKNIYSYA